MIRNNGLDFTHPAKQITHPTRIDMADEETKEAKPKAPRLKGSKNFGKRVEESVLELRAEAKSIATAPRGAKGAAAQIRALWPEGSLFVLVSEIASGQRRATREQLAACKELMDRGWGRAPETHIVGSMDSEQREAAAALTKEQLLGLLDAGSGPLATEVATDVVQGTVVTEETT